ncbi:F0F1 ATP synthase subunit A [Rarobacter faecitabidus]|uniref:ATP synthase subunit a n=1 Tax=Rarobacter faecitabidus TaxID=13243 RepID=A0A542ZX61_RARFA|nr:F0F1 ATP synthase subunit A [Rarobacter faecitabidus]TQL64937.1 ATP synthase F0 subcomplex A subunit [Rarobacter faecitabidus]
MITLQTLLIAEGGAEEFHAPSLADFFPPAIWFEGTVFEITRLQLIQFLATAVVLTVLLFAARRAVLVPGRLQSAIELLLDFVRVQIVESTFGAGKGKKYIGIVTTIFITVLAFNLTSIVPGINLPINSRIGVPLLLALWVMVAYWAAGIKKHGLWGYLKGNMFPPGVPVFVYPILAPIELLQILVIRPASLIIRLLANMVAGHIMLALTYLATHYFLTVSAGGMKAISGLTFAASLGMTLFEVFVAALQAYIFALLAAVYINMSLEEEH